MDLDPDAARALELIKAAGRPPYQTLSAAEARQAYSSARVAVAPEPQEVAGVRDLSAPGPNGPFGCGTTSLGVPRASRSRGSSTVTAAVGCWEISDSHDTVCRHLANATQCAVVAVDYRLAPEHKFPAGVDDALAATAWVAAHAADLGIDPQRIAVGGDSAGATLAAVTCLAARDAGRPRLRYQLLIYPVTDFDMRTPSQEQLADGHLLTRGNQLWFQANYLRGPADKADWRASPLKVASVAASRRHSCSRPAMTPCVTRGRPMRAAWSRQASASPAGGCRGRSTASCRWAS